MQLSRQEMGGLFALSLEAKSFPLSTFSRQKGNQILYLYLSKEKY